MCRTGASGTGGDTNKPHRRSTYNPPPIFLSPPAQPLSSTGSRPRLAPPRTKDEKKRNARKRQEENRNKNT
ncbi:hypothetical protein E2C01_090719 [Portunus trituberculatus]|uniref:Uncharacterized protein n=1 Tax=Portunus trituberculatus TaxID=210409 RepID=A0A5B7JM37_PORTR|nr:hypothetical protein [Portunus trituberculatus]